jgi:hypothetical protein
LTASAVGTLALSLASRGIGAKVEARNESIKAPRPITKPG